MDCPKCGQVAPAGAAECAACGIIFARYNANARSSGRDLWVPPTPAVEPKRDSGNGILIVTGLFMAGLIGVAVYMKKTGARMPQFVEDGFGLILAIVLAAAVVIYKFMIVKNARL